MSEIEPIDEEFTYEGRAIISETDPQGNIIYANRKFCTISGYDKTELIGQPHNIIRHPDMPKQAFESLWNTISRGEVWRGIVKNLRRDGRYYWVDTTISPVIDDAGNINSYVAARKTASKLAVDEAAIEYAKLHNEESSK